MFLRCELLPGARSGYLSTYMPCHQMRSETNSERPRPASYIGSQAKRFEHFKTPAKPPFTLSRERRQNTHSRQSLLGAVTVDLWSHRQCLVSDGFETKLGRTDKVIPIQTGKLAIHTLGHLPTFSALWNTVGFPPETTFGVERQQSACKWTFVRGSAKVTKVPFPAIGGRRSAEILSGGWQTGVFCECEAYSHLPKPDIHSKKWPSNDCCAVWI
jgi:hypothetical protein